ncbi:Uncharacterized protein FWK35_00017352 [Aphis craccivora]|uniref:Uncharacterized protein n=1 Tax=Aphis craccivora TaxID=307492 RepID=A0A6G0YPJ2_APHCR|nr:Uncharacterized protein FWK35_00017352 [Aphis craccivora]
MIFFKKKKTLNVSIKTSRIWNNLTYSFKIPLVLRETFCVPTLEKPFNRNVGHQNTCIYKSCIVLDSERNDECIDFTMMCVFFFFVLSVYSITSRNIAPISNFGGGFRCKSEYPWCIKSFQKNREKQKKNDGKTEIFTQNQLSTKSIFFFMVVIQKLITFKILRNLLRTRKFANSRFLLPHNSNIDKNSLKS